MRLRGEPVWAAGERPPRHDVLGIVGRFEWDGESRALLKVACCSVYRLWLNGEFVAGGPARGPKGYFRVDEIDLTRHPRLYKTENALAIEVVSYGVNGYSMVKQPPFVFAELRLDGHPILWTHPKQGGFQACEVPGRLRKVARYSYQRPFSEAYRLGPDWDDWRVSPLLANGLEESALVPLTFAVSGQFLERRSPLPDFERRQPVAVVASGRWEKKPSADITKDWSVTEIGNHLEGYREEEFETAPMHEFQTLAITHEPARAKYDPGTTVRLTANDTRVYDFGVNLTGSIGLRILARDRCRIVLAFDEMLTESRVDPLRLGCVNTIQLELEPGEYDFETAEPYTLRYLEVLSMEGECEIWAIQLREVVHPGGGFARFSCSDAKLNRIYQAAVRTFRQNAVDIFMDCPSRERAGWLADSFFTARAAFLLTGDTAVEHDFLENFALPERFDALPDGMVPMCYPADHPSGQFIPQWAMWFVLQVEEYLVRSGDDELVAELNRKVEGVLRFFEPFENEHGLLESLPKWNFIEWSKANEWTQDVSFPTNMLYAATLDAAARLLDEPVWAEKARKVRETVRKMSYDGLFFVDNAVGSEGRLIMTGNRSEVCQYFAFYFGVASAETHPELWKVLVQEFGSGRTTHTDVAPANMLIGEVLRLELLARAGLSRQVCEELVSYTRRMADSTGTLWENNQPTASANHGFASHAAVWLIQEALGLRGFETVREQAGLVVPKNDLEWCEGILPIPAGPVEASWRRDGDGVVSELRLPAGYRDL
jgi:alpha-L-rhamnosidase